MKLTELGGPDSSWFGAPYIMGDIASKGAMDRAVLAWACPIKV